MAAKTRRSGSGSTRSPLGDFADVFRQAPPQDASPGAKGDDRVQWPRREFKSAFKKGVDRKQSQPQRKGPDIGPLVAVARKRLTPDYLERMHANWASGLSRVVGKDRDNLDRFLFELYRHAAASVQAKMDAARRATLGRTCRGVSSNARLLAFDFLEAHYVAFRHGAMQATTGDWQPVRDIRRAFRQAHPDLNCSTRTFDRALESFRRGHEAVARLDEREPGPRSPDRIVDYLVDTFTAIKRGQLKDQSGAWVSTTVAWQGYCHQFTPVSRSTFERRLKIVRRHFATSGTPKISA